MRNFYENAKKRTFEIMEKSQKGDIYSTIFDYFIVILISLNVISVFIETFELPLFYTNILRKFEIFSIIIFTIEYILRLWTSTLLQIPFYDPVLFQRPFCIQENRLRFAERIAVILF